MEQQNYYQILGIDSGADEQEIREAFRKMAFEYHPDRNSDDAQAADKMKQINEAYAVLSNAQKRSQYDLLLNQYGNSAQDHFRRSHSEQDIFSESDIQQIFEEMARAFGLRGFNDIFSDFQGQRSSSFERRQNGMHVRGFFFSGTSFKSKSEPHGGRLFGSLANKLLHKITGAYLPQQGEDIRDKITLQPELASVGGPYAYHHRAKDKKLVVHVPKGVRDGQVIRLAGLGRDGTHGASPGDLLLTVKVQKPMIDKIKGYFGLTS